VDFIERYLGFSPDHGDGSVEILLLFGIGHFCGVRVALAQGKLKASGRKEA
jgi:hypothetical protein